MSLRFDLQSHSTHSDGTLSATEVVERAAESGVELMALSDHDTISGVTEALDTGARSGVKVVPAVEISAVDDGSGGEHPEQVVREMLLRDETLHGLEVSAAALEDAFLALTSSDQPQT